ncbi:hypothetical protein CJU79_20035 [Pseudomonas fragi]|uniref:hypothetical protein n=1 Tax=Pseudomonas fragi TaxID=296 RepID=UPI000BA2232E|nr:hypothetical protein [Pseudomonas fragi]PAA35320.1 hypothetical protein CJU79_20035 [Pseudomonas fragi]
MTAHCLVEVDHPILKFAENRSSLHVLNKNKRAVVRHQVDGCLIVEGKKCDWLLVDKLTGSEIFIELKGSDVDVAVKQLCASVEALGKKGKKKFGYVVCTRSPLASPAIQRLQKSVMKSHHLNLRVKTITHSEEIENLI